MKKRPKTRKPFCWWRESKWLVGSNSKTLETLEKSTEWKEPQQDILTLRLYDERKRKSRKVWDDGQDGRDTQSLLSLVKESVGSLFGLVIYVPGEKTKVVLSLRRHTPPRRVNEVSYNVFPPCTYPHSLQCLKKIGKRPPLRKEPKYYPTTKSKRSSEISTVSLPGHPFSQGIKG